MSRDQVSPAHMQRWDNIRQLEVQVTKENKNKYNMEDLKKKCVRILRMNYDSNLEPTFRPCFFELYKGELSAEPRDEQRVASGWEWDPYHENEEADPIEWAEDTIYYFFDYLAAQGVDNEDKGVKLPLRRMMSYVRIISFSFLKHCVPLPKVAIRGMASANKYGLLVLGHLQGRCCINTDVTLTV